MKSRTKRAAPGTVGRLGRVATQRPLTEEGRRESEI